MDYSLFVIINRDGYVEPPDAARTRIDPVFVDVGDTNLTLEPRTTKWVDLSSQLNYWEIYWLLAF